MIKGLRGATIWSEDLNQLVPFYRDVLGFKVGLDTKGFVILGDRQRPLSRSALTARCVVARWIQHGT